MIIQFTIFQNGQSSFNCISNLNLMFFTNPNTRQTSHQRLRNVPLFLCYERYDQLIQRLVIPRHLPLDSLPDLFLKTLIRTPGTDSPLPEVRHDVQHDLSNPQTRQLFQNIHVDYVILKQVIVESTTLFYLTNESRKFLFLLRPVQLTQHEDIPDRQIRIIRHGTFTDRPDEQLCAILQDRLLRQRQEMQVSLESITNQIIAQFSGIVHGK